MILDGLLGRGRKAGIKGSGETKKRFDGPMLDYPTEYKLRTKRFAR